MKLLGSSSITSQGWNQFLSSTKDGTLCCSVSTSNEGSVVKHVFFSSRFTLLRTNACSSQTIYCFRTRRTSQPSVPLHFLARQGPSASIFFASSTKTPNLRFFCTQRLHFFAKRLQFFVCTSLSTAHVHLVHFRSTHALIDAHFVDPRVDLCFYCPISKSSSVVVTLRLAPLLEAFAKRRAKHSALHVHVLFAPVRRSSETNLRVLRYFHTTQVLYPHVCQQTSL